MSVAWRITIGAVAIAAICWGKSAFFATPRQTLPVRPLHRELSRLPEQLGAWRGKTVPLDPKLFPDDGADRSLARVYSDGQGAAIELYLAVWLSADHTPRHPPEICHIGNGYTILEKKQIVLDHAEPAGRTARLLAMEKNGRPLDVLYWYQSGGRISGYWVRRGTWTAGGEEAVPPLVKVMISLPAGENEGAEETLRRFGSAVMAWTVGL